MKLCRFRTRADSAPHAGLVQENEGVLDLALLGIDRLETLWENPDRLGELDGDVSKHTLPLHGWRDVELLTPVERQEVWAVGVTYIRSKAARMEESDFSATAYDRVYAAERPELFFKSIPEKVVGPGGRVGIRQDAKWSVPEPELTLVINSQRRLVGFTVGNDMSSRDIEGENLLYLPQAKIYDGSCAIGPWVTVSSSEAEARQWTIELNIHRHHKLVFAGQTSVNQIKRAFDGMVEYLFRSQTFPHGAVLMTGTGIVPPDDFSLLTGDRIEMRISGIGVLRNDVVAV